MKIIENTEKYRKCIVVVVAPKVEPKTIQNCFQNRSQNEAKTDMGNQRKSKRGAPTPKTMLQCRRGAHLHNSASFTKTRKKKLKQS